MTTAEEILALLKLPGLFPETIELLNRAVAAAKTKPTTTMKTTEEIHAAAVKNVEGNHAAAIVHILNVLRKLPPSITINRMEEAQAAQTVDTTAGGRFDSELRAYHKRLARLAIGEMKSQNPGYSMNASEGPLADQFGMMEPRPVPEPRKSKALAEIPESVKQRLAAAEPAPEAPAGTPPDFCIATQWKQPHHYFTDSLGKAYCANCRQPQPASEAKRITWTADPDETSQWRGYLAGTTICLFLINQNPWGTFGMGGGIIPDGEDWDGPNSDRTMDELQARAETYVAKLQSILTR